MPADPMARIWTTYKTRILSEQRFNKYAVASHLALTWYAFLSIVFSIYQGDIAKTLGEPGASQASLVMAVMTFGLSLVIYGFKFEDSARTHRDCYLKMQSIFQSTEPDQSKLHEYRKLLEHFPNHATRDYRQLLFNGWRAGALVTDTQGNAVPFDGKDAALVYARYILNIVAIIIIFLVPLALITYWLVAPKW